MSTSFLGGNEFSLISGGGSAGTSGTSGAAGIAGGQLFYMNLSLNTSSAFGTPTYKQLSATPTGGAQQNVATIIASGDTAILCTFATDSGNPGTTQIPNGNFGFTGHFISNLSPSNISVY